MTPTWVIVLIIITAVMALTIPILLYMLGIVKDRLDFQITANARLLSQKKSSEVRTGQIAEQLAPFLKEFKYNPKRTHFIGMPIDFIVFEEDKVVFLEIKSGKAQLSQTQKAIKALVQAGKVEWDEMRIDGKDQEEPPIEPSK
jgi:predicted Holliday junction resolvase-like endonuclease